MTVGTSRLDHKYTAVSAFLSLIICPEESQLQSYKKTHWDGNMRPPANSPVSVPSWKMIPGPARAFRGLQPHLTLTAITLRDHSQKETLSQNPTAKQLPNSQPTENCIINVVAALSYYILE